MMMLEYCRSLLVSRVLRVQRPNLTKPSRGGVKCDRECKIL